MAKDDSHHEYSPSLPAAGIVIAVFTVLACTHAYLFLKSRTRFCIPFFVGALCNVYHEPLSSPLIADAVEIIGYAGRAVGHTKPESLIAYIIQALLILLAPIIFAASVYMFLGRIVRATGRESYAMIRPSRMTKIFVSGDILCFLIQAAGGGILAGADTKSSQNLGKIVILAGLVLQMVIFGFFMAVGIAFHSRARSLGNIGKDQCQWNWERYLWMLYIVSVLITVRNLFRVIEYAMGKDSYLMETEWPIYVFDALLMVFVCGIACFWHVGQITPATAETSGNFEMMGTDEESRLREG